jgi:hypothetical protein
VSATLDLDRLHQALRLTFDIDVQGSLSSEDLQLENLNAPSPGSLNVQLGEPTAMSGLVRTLPIGPGGVLADGNYELNLPRQGVSPELTADFVHHDFFLNGDFNRDRAVNFADQLILTQNYGQANKTWSQGDMNLDGAVDFADLLALAQRYGVALSPQPTYEGALVVDPLPFLEDGSTPLRTVWTQHAGVDGYSVFRSQDGTHFDRVHSMTAAEAAASGYAWTDTTPAPGSKVWYRVRPYIIDSSGGSPAMVHQHTTAKDWAVAVIVSPTKVGLADHVFEPVPSVGRDVRVVWESSHAPNARTEVVLERRIEDGSFVEVLRDDTGGTPSFISIEFLKPSVIYRLAIREFTAGTSTAWVYSQEFVGGQTSGNVQTNEPHATEGDGDWQSLNEEAIDLKVGELLGETKFPDGSMTKVVLGVNTVYVPGAPITTSQFSGPGSLMSEGYVSFFDQREIEIWIQPRTLIDGYAVAGWSLNDQTDPDDADPCSIPAPWTFVFGDDDLVIEYRASMVTKQYVVYYNFFNPEMGWLTAAYQYLLYQNEVTLEVEYRIDDVA